MEKIDYRTVDVEEARYEAISEYYQRGGFSYDHEPRTRIMACSKTRDHQEHAPHEWTSARDENLTWQCYGYIAPGQALATRTAELARFFSDRPTEAAAPAPTRKGGEIETVWCEAHGPAAHFLRDDCVYPHFTDQITRARLNDQFEILRRAEEIARMHGNTALADELYGFGCHLGSAR